MSKLAIDGGEKSVTLPYPQHPMIDDKELNAVKRVFERNQFSQFIASAGKNFLGGEEVQGFETEVAQFVDCKYGVAYNSWTSGLHAAVAAAIACHDYNISMGDGVFCTPYSFTSSATCALMNNLVPVFVDVDPITCNISPENLLQSIYKHPTVKILVLVHLFGLPADLDVILEICRKHNILVIEDAAQAPGAMYKERMIGSIGDAGGFSFTQSKAVMCGEGGVLVTNREDIANASRMVRNHGEAVTDGDRTYDAEVLGMGYRITEIAAAIGRAQWKKLEFVNDVRIDLNKQFQEFILQHCDFITFQRSDYNAKHVYYTTAMLFDEQKAGISRDAFCDAIIAEGVPISKGYVKPLYMQKLYQEKRHPVLRMSKECDFGIGLCPNAEFLWKNKLFFTMVLRPPMSLELFDQIKLAFLKVINATINKR